MLDLKFLTFAAVVVYLGTTIVFADETEMYVECIKEVGLSDEQIKEMQESGQPDPCLLSCFFKKLNVFNNKGMYDLENAMKHNRNYTQDEALLAKLDAIDRDCAKVNDEETSDGDKGCDRALKLYQCFMDQQFDVL